MNLRNVAIIAHVDHGKTTLVDRLLQQSGVYRENQRMVERAMDSNDLERERGITILAKAASVEWQGTRINIVDTPGHADFGGEVERILNMVDGALVLVDAAEGPLPQTKFVVSKALKMGLKPIVVINKVDRADARPHEVVNEVFDLFAALDATDEQLDFPILYGSAKQGWMAASARRLAGRRHAAAVRSGAQPCQAAGGRGGAVPPARHHPGSQSLSRPHRHRPHHLGLGQAEPGGEGARPRRQADRDRAASPRCSPSAGSSACRWTRRKPATSSPSPGCRNATVAHTICDPSVETPLPAQPIDPPTLAMIFRVNDSPLAGTEGDKVTGRMIRDRLLREAEGNVALRVREAHEKDSMEVAGRGELQLGILIETMRREGFELSVSRPKVLLREDLNTGDVLEPIEEVVIDVDEEHSGIVVQKMVGAQSRDDRDAPVRRRPAAARLPCADARADRLSGRTAHRHARHRHHEPAVPRLCAATRGRSRAAATAC